MHSVTAPQRQSWLTASSGALILGVDWLFFGAEVVTLPFGVILAPVAAFAIAATGVFWLQRKRAGDSLSRALLKAVFAGVVAGIPTSIAGTAVGTLVLGLAGLSRFRLRRSTGASSGNSIGAAAIAAACLSSAVSCTDGPAPAAELPFVMLAIPGRANLNVSLTANDGYLVAAWTATAGDTTDIFAAVSVDGGQSFGVPARVNMVPGQAIADSERPPRVTMVPRAGHSPEFVVVWSATFAQGTRLLSARSGDVLGSFGVSVVVPDSDAARYRDSAARATGNSGRTDTLAPNQRGAVQALTGGSCVCCQMTLVTMGSSVYAAWRHLFPGNQRDIAVAISRDSGRTFGAPVRVSHGIAQVSGCPKHGPALVVNRAGRINVAWVSPAPGGTTIKVARVEPR